MADYNDEQVKRAVALAVEQTLETLQKPDRKTSAHHDPEFVTWLDKRIGERMRLWAFGMVTAYCVPALGLVFVLGGLRADMQMALNDQRANTQTLYSRGQFVRDQLKFNCELKEAVQPMIKRPIGNCSFASADDPRDVRR